MKQIQGGDRTQRDFLYGISNMLSSSTLYRSRCQAPQRQKEKNWKSYCLLCVYIMWQELLSAGHGLTLLNSPLK